MAKHLPSDKAPPGSEKPPPGGVDGEEVDRLLLQLRECGEWYDGGHGLLHGTAADMIEALIESMPPGQRPQAKPLPDEPLPEPEPKVEGPAPPEPEHEARSLLLEHEPVAEMEPAELEPEEALQEEIDEETEPFRPKSPKPKAAKSRRR